MKEAAKTRPWMDLGRVGIVGSSEGGANAAAALLHHGHFYKVAISSSGAHDQTLSNLWWSEQWLGYPAHEAAVENSNTTHAKKLPENAKLMLIAGGMDHALNPASVMRLVQELNKYNKMYELVFIPGGGHECGSEPYALMRAEVFLKANLCS
jgi:dipeptidyl aminopeptidase/acylaminoacyl peptidase